MIIHGAGPLATIVDGQGANGVFEVRASATISGLTIRGGQEFSGGGIYAVPDTTLTLTVRDTQLTDNRAAHGGAVFVDGGAVVLLERVSISGNTGVTSGAPSRSRWRTAAGRHRSERDDQRQRRPEARGERGSARVRPRHARR